MFRTKMLLAFASVVFGVAFSAVGCGDTELNEGSTGSGKGAEMTMTMETGRPTASGASTMSQSNPPTPLAPTAPACGEGLACIGALTGCIGACSPRGVITACARCDDGVLADCTERACQP